MHAKLEQTVRMIFRPDTTPPINNLLQDPVSVNELYLPHSVIPVGDNPLMGGESNLANSEVSDLSLLDSPGYVATNGVLTVGLQQPMSSYPSPIMGLPMSITSAQQPVPQTNVTLPKPTVTVKKPRGRRPRPPPKRPTKLVLLAPATNGCPPPASVGNTQYGGFATEEEYKAHQKKLRSRESAAKSNERRRNKRLQEEQRRKKVSAS